MKASWAAIAAIAIASPTAAQMDHANHAPAVDGVRALYETVKGYITRSAEQMPEADYAFKPTPEVRSFAGILGHIANANYMFCSTALGEESPSQQDAEELTSKTELQAALAASFEYCDRAYGISESQAMEPVQVFGRDATKLYALEFNMGHDFEHYGNLVTYLRLKGMVPPSSQRGQ